MNLALAHLGVAAGYLVVAVLYLIVGRSDLAAWYALVAASMIALAEAWRGLARQEADRG